MFRHHHHYHREWRRAYAHSLRTRGHAASAALAPEVVTSTANATIKHATKLRTSSKYRQEQLQFVLSGLGLLKEAAAGVGGRLQVDLLVLPLQDQRPGAVAAAAAAMASSAVLAQPPEWLVAQRVVHVTDSVLKKLSGLENVDGLDAVAILPTPQRCSLLQDWAPVAGGSASSSSSSSAAAAAAAAAIAGREGHQPQGWRYGRMRRLLALEAVQDPGNLGALVRSAVAFGWDSVFLLPGCCDPFNDKAVRASRGAVLRLPICSGTWHDLVQGCEHHGLRLLAADAERPGGAQRRGGGGQAADGAACLVMGSEGQGLSQAVREACEIVSVPMVGDMESLNCAIAGSILMFALSPGGASRLSSRIATLDLEPLCSPR